MKKITVEVFDLDRAKEILPEVQIHLANLDYFVRTFPGQAPMPLTKNFGYDTPVGEVLSLKCSGKKLIAEINIFDEEIIKRELFEPRYFAISVFQSDISPYRLYLHGISYLTHVDLKVKIPQGKHEQS